VVYIPRLGAIHLNEGSGANRSRAKRKNMMKGMYLFFEKHGNMVQKKCYRLITPFV